ncbi:MULTISPECIES: glycine betaine ABC transporter substrate-binding protein [Ramlibacter]|uniref:ABC transporter permease subunit n=1 Tax=Ramlibacter pinisoli TaxID=2682844 RepID=A0A6N8IYK0_9BURK|nr:MULTISPECIES: glycine betaine ABC transporter substrate-binding protein [Ramlibacter]MBA2961129.1 ABC transporter permease subunit [Ramlibacter sp. CGMCC 1.13660]MVQ31073.1 ABC transporter permease subunit [Ramlibacter pinisoli]
MRPRLLSLLPVLLATWMAGCGAAAAADRLVVGSKRFTESYILGEIVARTAQQAGAEAVHRQGLGSTAVVLEALKTGSIDVYPEYIGTIESEILKLPAGSSDEVIRRELGKMGLSFGVPLGFANSYALATTAQRARELSLRTIGDLRRQPALPVALSQEFLGRVDGWPGLAQRYRLPHQPTGIDHGVAYEALASGRIAVTDIYTTDAKIAELGLAVLQDDQHYFPRYDSVLLYRSDLPARAPAAWKAVAGLEGRIDTARMIALNGDAELRGRSFSAIAADFVQGAAAAATPAGRAGLGERLFGPDLGRLTREHIGLVAISLAVAVVLGVPLGAAAAARHGLGHWIFGATGLLQTIPSLALLAALIPLLGRIGTVPAVIALSLYALLPIVRNTATGLDQVPAGLKQAGVALGMTPAQRWRSVDLPLALPVILAGVKTAAVLTVGTATIAAFIGAGGYGERIAQGLALNDGATLLAGAIPAAALALVTQAVFEVLERWTGRRRWRAEHEDPRRA